MPHIFIEDPDLAWAGPIITIHVMPPAAVIDAIVASGGTPPLPTKIDALIDTGATETIIAADLPEALSLNPICNATIATASSSRVECYRYPIRINLPDDMLTLSGTAIALPFKLSNVKCLMGRDFLRFVVLVYNGPKNQVIISV